MSYENTALILVDIQNNFCPGGALAVPEGDEIVPLVNRLMVKFPHVVATQDWHPENHGSFAVNHPGTELGSVGELDGLPQVMWPAHCVQGSEGAELRADLDEEGIDAIVQKGMDPLVDSYSGFFDNAHRNATGLERVLKDKGIDEIYVCGLATDYCVKFTALDAVELGFKVTLILDVCRGVNLTPGDVDKAVEEMKEKGVAIVTSDQL